MLAAINRFIDNFRREDDGSIAVEAILMFPILTWAYLATFVYFDGFRNQSNNVKAAYTISDALSRETGYVTPVYLTSLYKLHEGLTTANYNTKLRVTVVTYSSDEDKYSVVWSEQKGRAGVLNDTKLDLLRDRLPVMPDNEVVILVQTWVAYEPAFSVGLEAFNFENFVVTRPRFAPQLCYNSLETGDLDTAIC